MPNNSEAEYYYTVPAVAIQPDSKLFLVKK